MNKVLQDRLDGVAIRAALPENRKQIEIQVFGQIDSTNTQAKAQLSAGLQQVKLFVAETQTSGRGRRGRTFYSPEQSGIYLSLAVYPDLPLQQGLRITAAAAVAVRRALQAYTSADLGIKWVNDIYLGDKKVCGILVEGISDFQKGILKSAVIGVGVNIRTMQMPPFLPEAASLEIPPHISRNKIVADITQALLCEMDKLQRTDLMAEYRAASILMGREITFEQQGITQRARVLDIDEHGGLVICLPDGVQQTLTSGEITIRPISEMGK